MLVTSTAISPAQSIIIFRTKSILGFRLAVKSILFDTISSRADAKSINGNGFLSDLAKGLKFFVGLAARGLFFLPHCAKYSLSKSKSLIFVVSVTFLHGSHSFAELVHDGFVEPVQKLQQQHDCTFHHCPPYKCNDTNEFHLNFLKLSKIFEMGH